MKNVHNKYADVPIRIRSWLVIILIVVISLSYATLTYIAVGLLAFTAYAEYMSIQNIVADKYYNYRVYGIPCIVFLVLGFSAYCNSYTILLLGCGGIILGIAIFVLFMFVLDKSKERINIGCHQLIGLMIGVMLGHLAFIINLDVTGTNGIKLVLLLIIATECNDIFQYLTGKRFGKRKIAPHVSPNKTVEGFLGGLILTPVLTNLLGLFFLPDRNMVFYTLLGFGIATLGFCGDLFISKIKRRAGVKDTGKLIPGHGGLLDRTDSLIFSAPLYYWLIRLIYC